MKEIKEPDWDKLLKVPPGWTLAASIVKLNEWFAENIKGKLVIDPSDVVEVYQERKLMDSLWDTKQEAGAVNYDTKALLIRSSIQPIEKDSFEKLVRDFAKKGSQAGSAWPNEVCKLFGRAVKLLEGE